MDQDPQQEEHMAMLEVVSGVVGDRDDSLALVKADPVKAWFTAGQLQFGVDAAWDPRTQLLAAPPPQDPVISRKYDSVANDSYIKKSFGGRIESIVKALARADLVTEDFPSTCPFSVIAHIIKNDLLNPATRLESLPLFLGVGSGGQCVTVWPRTALCFQLLSAYLNISITVFSSTEMPRKYCAGQSGAAICFLHRKDALRDISEFDVIGIAAPSPTSFALASAAGNQLSTKNNSSAGSAPLSRLSNPCPFSLPPLRTPVPPSESSTALLPVIWSVPRPQPPTLSISEWPSLPSVKTQATPLQSSGARPSNFMSSSNAWSVPPIASPSAPLASPFTAISSSSSLHQAFGADASTSASQDRPFAIFRQIKRRIKYAPRDSRDHLTEAILKTCYTEACDEKVQEEVRMKVERMWKKRKRDELFDDVFTIEKKTKVLDELSEKRSLPQGLVDRATEIVQTSNPNSSTFHKHNLTATLKTPYRQEKYQERLALKFNEAWNSAITIHIPRSSATTTTTTTTTITNTTNTNSDGTAKDSGPGSALIDVQDCLALEDEEEIADLLEREEKVRSTKSLKTVTVSLKDIIRKELVASKVDQDPDKEPVSAADKLVDVLLGKQDILTNATDELACIARKTTLLLAQNAFTMPGLSPETSSSRAPQQHPPVYDICTDLIPNSFVARNDTPSTLTLAPLPTHLEEYINTTPSGSDRLWTSDLQQLFSYHHLGFLYSKFFSPQGVSPDSETKHPLWSQLATHIQAPPVEALKATWAPGDDHPMAGLSTVFCDYRVELATNFKNLWDGPLYTKALDFLLRFTLRFQLAPNRELQYYTRVKELASRKMQQKQSDRTRSLDFKTWKDKSERLQDELGQLVAKGGSRTDRISALLEMLGQHARTQPSIGQGGVRKAEFGGADPVMEAKMMLEVMEDALDEFDEEAETEENQAQEDQSQKDTSDTPQIKEPSRSHLRSIQAITKILLESPNLDVSRLNASWVRRTAHKPGDMTDDQCDTVVRLVKALDQFTPKRVPDSLGTGTSPPTANAAAMIRIVLLSNHVLKYTGYTEFTRRFAPAPSVASLHPVPLGAAGIYDTLCWKAPNNFDIYDQDMQHISSVETATKNKEAVFSNFFDLDAINTTCKKYNLRFSQRLTFVNRYTIRILGEVIPEGEDRGNGAPVVSVLDESKKDKTQKRAAIDWSREGPRTGITQQMAQERLVTLNSEIKDIEKEQKAKRDAWVAADQYRHEAAVYQRQNKQRSSQHSGSTTKADSSKTRRLDQEQDADLKLRAARMASDTAFLDWTQKDDTLRLMKATRYALQRIQKTRPNYDPPPNKKPLRADPTWTRPAVEAKTENLYIDCLLDAVLADPTKAIGFDGDDPGLCKLDTSATTTLTGVTQSIRQYSVLTGNPFALLAEVDMMEENKSEVEQEQATVFLPPTHNITAPQINDLTFSTKHQRKRQYRLAATTPEATAARDALATLSNMSINNTSTLTDIDNAQNARRSSRQPCRLFENSSWRIKDQATQEIQTKRVYATLASGQRDKVKEIVLQESRAAALDIQVQGSDKSEIGNTSSSSSTQPSDIKTAAVKPGQSLHTECKEVETSQTQHSISRDEDIASVKGKGVVTEEPKDTESQDRGESERNKGLVSEKKNIIPIVLHGAAGTAVGSRIKGHAKRGGSKLTQQHRRYGPVGQTNENRTSRICSCCFVPVKQSRATRIKDGESKTVRLNGSVDCRNPRCPRRQAGRGTMGRDANAANNILISGASILLSATHTALPPYRPFSLTPTMTASASDLEPKTRNPKPPNDGCVEGLSI
ncbi:MAG: hypothetical protein J3R72DRAFT_383384 [Linnemannia gamsii]|nr:MAG: hypothetical protein J3R72DRAFT_383384 [Linnemannia gamsii]